LIDTNAPGNERFQGRLSSGFSPGRSPGVS
jgi:hypothetical protein